MTPTSTEHPSGSPAAARGRRGPPTSRSLAERYGVSLRQVERTRRLAATELGRRLLKHLSPRGAERLLWAANEGLIPIDALLRPRSTTLRLLRHWRAGQLGALPPPALGRRPAVPAVPPEPWMFDPRLLGAYCRLAARACPALRIDIRRLRTALRRALGR
ncbi:MAG TPA: hypothetical protein VNK50_10145 [Calidithermus sp.]|nr:hypothetical protein [Calidithermus sp.]